MATLQDSAIYEYCESLFDEYHKNDGGYYPSKHDALVFQNAALKFGISHEEVSEIYTAHSKSAAEIEMKKIEKFPAARRKKIIKERACDIMLNNFDLPFHKIEGAPHEPLPSATASLEEEYKEPLIKMAKHGWTIPQSMALYSFSSIVPFVDDEEKVDKYFSEYYQEKVFEKMVKHIENSLNNPAHVQGFNECITAYKTKMFTICLSGLTPILEGVLSLYGDSLNDVRMIRICQYHADEAARKKQKIKSLCWLSMGEFVRVLFEKSKFDEVEPNKLNRHWLIHGRSSKIGEQADCLRLFNAISTLVSIKTFEG